MIQFKKMISLANTFGVIDLQASNLQPDGKILNNVYMSKTKILDLITNAKVFVLKTGIEHTMVDALEDKNFDKAYNIEALPFKVCFFESLSEDGAIAKITNNKMPIYEQVNVCQGVLVSELSPGNIEIIVMMTNKFGTKLFKTTITKNSGPFAIIVEDILKTLNEQKMGIAEVNEKIKIKGPNKQNLFHKINKLIYVCPKKETVNFNPEGRVVNWSHRWLTRGHWRILKNADGSPGLGKDRNGEYCVLGFTWVIDHEKGPKDLPLVADKVRLVVKKPMEPNNNQIRA